MDLTPIYILHTRPFRNTSLLVDAFSEIHGRISLVAKSARGPKSRYQGQLQLFTPIAANWSGKFELKSLNKMELVGMPLQLNQQALFSGFYLNELLVRLLQKEDAYPKLFYLYQDTLQALEEGHAIEMTLRKFEKNMLAILGYGLPISRDAKTGFPIDADKYYDYYPQHGFRCQLQPNAQSFLGNDLMAMANDCFESESVLQASKRLMRMALAPLLGDKPLQSRSFF